MAGFLKSRRAASTPAGAAHGKSSQAGGRKRLALAPFAMLVAGLILVLHSSPWAVRYRNRVLHLSDEDRAVERHSIQPITCESDPSSGTCAHVDLVAFASVSAGLSKGVDGLLEYVRYFGTSNFITCTQARMFDILVDKNVQEQTCLL